MPAVSFKIEGIAVAALDQMACLNNLNHEDGVKSPTGISKEEEGIGALCFSIDLKVLAT
jgi:hypothetical protein